MQPSQRFAVVLESPRRVGAKDKRGWIDLFAPGGYVEDPVEAGQYVGPRAIEAFWDVFIAPQPSIGFEVQRDFVGSNTVFRQATVVTVTRADPERELRVPALLHYEVQDGQILALRAIWNPTRVVQWFLRRGGTGLRVLGGQSTRMLRHVGLGKAVRFSKTVATGISESRARTLVETIAHADAEAWSDPLARAEIEIQQDEDRASFAADPSRAAAFLREHMGEPARLHIDQLVRCGNHVGAFLGSDGPGALALMFRTGSRGEVRSMRAIWSPEPGVLHKSPDKSQEPGEQSLDGTSP